MSPWMSTTGIPFEGFFRVDPAASETSTATLANSNVVTSVDVFNYTDTSAMAWRTVTDGLCSPIPVAKPPIASTPVQPVPQAPEAETPTPQPTKIIRFIRRILPKKIKKLIRDIIASPDTSKSHVADAVAIGVLGGFSPIPLTNFPAAAALAKICKRSPLIAMFATVYNNIFTVAPMVYAEVQLGKIFFPNSLVAAGVAGTLMLAAILPILSRQLTMLTYDRLRVPGLKLMTAVSEENPRPDNSLPTPTK